ncbi:MAG: hypothetical protein Q4A12_06975 [Eubacteriales bacterium]|nr:hypothetical protein [Eubacteriales bacterium]
MTDTYSFMKSSLDKLSIYSFDNTNIDIELQVYAQVLDELNNTLVEMLDECFCDSASSYGLSQRELVIGAVRDDLAIAQRRNMLKLRESIDKSSFTLEKIKASLESFGLTDYDLNEYPSQFTVVIYANGIYTSSQKAWIRKQVEKIMPAHLITYVIFNGPTWDESDSKNNTFEYIDSLDKTWEEIDNYE